MAQPAEPDPTNVVLTGFMGTGKTTVGREVARLIDSEFVDTDAMIEQRNGPIPEIFRRFGEPTFRRLESEVAAEVAARRGLVIATGGGLLLDDDNAATLAASGTVFCLTASVDTILARVTADDLANDRPLLTGSDVRERIQALLDQRTDTYGRFEQVDTEGKTPAVIAGEIVARLKS